MIRFFLLAEDFILKSATENTLGDQHASDEIALFLLTLLYQHKKEVLED